MAFIKQALEDFPLCQE